MDDELPPEAFDWLSLPEDRVKRHRAKKRRDQLVDWWNAEAGKHPQGEFTSRMIGAGSLPAVHTGRETWLPAVPKAFRKAEEEVAETHWVQQRRKPTKSRDHDQPWPGAAGWAPRRWFPGLEQSEWGTPLQIAVPPSAWEPRTTSLAWKWRWPTS